MSFSRVSTDAQGVGTAPSLGSQSQVPDLNDLPPVQQRGSGGTRGPKVCERGFQSTPGRFGAGERLVSSQVHELAATLYDPRQQRVHVGDAIGT